MGIIVIIVIIFLVVTAIGKLWGGEKNIEAYGPPAFFLRGLINELKSRYPEHRVKVESSNRLKIIFYTNFFTLDLDITYRNNYILIALLMDIFHNKRGRILKCPYNAAIVESEFRSKITELLTM